MSELGPTIDTPAHRERNRKKVAARRLLELAQDQELQITRGNLRDLARAEWPNRTSTTREEFVTLALFDHHQSQRQEPKTESDDDETPRPNKQELTEEHKQRAREICMNILRKAPDAEWRVARIEVKRRLGFYYPEKAFIRGPWRIAKMKVRKERTGSIRKKEKRPVEAPTPAPTEPEEDTPAQGVPEDPAPVRAQPRASEESSGDVIFSARTPRGTLVVRRRDDGEFDVDGKFRASDEDVAILLPQLGRMLVRGVFAPGDS